MCAVYESKNNIKNHKTDETRFECYGRHIVYWAIAIVSYTDCLFMVGCEFFRFGTIFY